MITKQSFSHIIVTSAFFVALGISFLPVFRTTDLKLNDFLVRTEYTHSTDFSSDTILYTMTLNDQNKIQELGEASFYTSMAFLTSMYLEKVPVYLPSMNLSNPYSKKQLFYTAGLKKFIIQCEASNPSQAKTLNYKNSKEEIEFINKQLLYPQFTNSNPDENKIPQIGYIYFPEFNDLKENNLKISISNPQEDEDGILRKMPLLYKYQDGFLPSTAFSFLIEDNEIKKNNIYINQGKDITLYTKDNHKIIIPIDEKCRITINFDQLKNGSSKKSFYTLFQDYKIIENQKVFISDETYPSLNFIKTSVSNDVPKSNLEFHAFCTLQDQKFKIDFSNVLKCIILLLGLIITISTTYIKNILYHAIANIFYICIIIVSGIIIFFNADIFVWIAAPVFIQIFTLITYLLLNKSEIKRTTK